jgi:hypothetical protein
MSYSFPRKFHRPEHEGVGLDYEDERAKRDKPLINVNLFELSALCGVGSFLILLVQLVRKAP